MKVSVVIITYNQQHCVERAIAGVMHQRGNFDIELIVANDASTDDTLTHVKRWQRRYPEQIKIINHEENVGFRANYLSAFRAATGKYLAVCDADDFWIARDKLAAQVHYMENHPECAVTFHRVINHYEATGEMSLSNGKQAVDTDITHLSRSNYITNLSVMYRRELCTDYPEWLATVSLPDYAYHMLYASKGTIHYFTRPMGVYNHNTAGAWSLNTEARRLEMSLDVRLRLLEHLGPKSPAYEGLRNASVDILIALMDIACTEADHGSYDHHLQRLQKIAPHLSPSDIEQRLERRAIFMASRRKGSPMKWAKRAYRMLTRLMPKPKPC